MAFFVWFGFTHNGENRHKSGHKQGTAAPAPTPAKTDILEPTTGWKNPVENHYDEDNFIFEARKKYLPKEIWDLSNGKTQDFEKEEKAMREAIAKNPGNTDVLYLLAYNQFDREKYDEAIKIFEDILKIKPDEERAVEGRAYAWYKKELYATSKKMAIEALKKYPRNPRLMHVLAGSYLFGERNPHKAIEIYEKAIKVDPNDVRLWLGWGESYLEIKSPEASRKGVEILTECIRRFPKYHIAYIVVGEEHQLQGNYREAVRFLEKSMELDPIYYRAYADIGDMLVDLGRYKEAEAYYQRTLKTNPRYEALIYTQIGRLYVILGNPEMAEKCFREGISVHKDNPEDNQEKAMAYLELSRLESKRKNFAKAREYIDNAFKDFPHYEYNHYYLALLYLDEGKFAQAEKQLRKSYDKNTPEDSMEPFEIDYGFARIYAAAGKFDKAMKNLEASAAALNSYRKLSIYNQSLRDEYMVKLRDYPGYAGFKSEMEKLRDSLPKLIVNKNLLKLRYEEEQKREDEED
ncbi:MAG: tetratricopeptide repeat protein [Firmicutes bacterium]|nr:tetratricopeptide repeat protein [Bacillota bacterium]